MLPTIFMCNKHEMKRMIACSNGYLCYRTFFHLYAPPSNWCESFSWYTTTFYPYLWDSLRRDKKVTGVFHIQNGNTTYLNHSTNSNIWRCLFVKLTSHRFGILHRQVSFLLSSTREMSLFNFLWIFPPCSDTRDTYHFIIIKVESFFTTDIIPSIPDDHKDKWYLHVYCISVNITMHPRSVQPQCTPATWRDRNFFKFFL